MARTPLTDDELREIARRMTAGESAMALAREFRTTRASIYQAGADIGGSRLAAVDATTTEHRAHWPKPSVSELAAGAIIAARGLTSPGRTSSPTSLGRQIVFDDIHATTVRKYRETGRLVVDGRLVTEADAREAQYRERWMEACDF